MPRIHGPGRDQVADAAQKHLEQGTIGVKVGKTDVDPPMPDNSINLGTCIADACNASLMQCMHWCSWQAWQQRELFSCSSPDPRPSPSNPALWLSRFTCPQLHRHGTHWRCLRAWALDWRPCHQQDELVPMCDTKLLQDHIRRSQHLMPEHLHHIMHALRRRCEGRHHQQPQGCWAVKVACKVVCKPHLCPGPVHSQGAVPPAQELWSCAAGAKAASAPRLCCCC